MDYPFVIDDATPDWVATPPGCERGLDLSGRPEGFAYGGTADPFPDDLLVPWSEMEARIKEREERRATNRDVVTQAGLPAKDQQRTNYCWIFAPTHCLEIVRVLQNQEPVSLSPASAGAQIKGFRNVGGWGKEGLEWIAGHGVCPSSAWPDTAIDRRYLTAENKALALKYRAAEWWELPTRVPRQEQLRYLFSALLHNRPVAVGYNWWSHEVTAVDPLWKDGGPALLIRNQWRGWGDDNYAVLQGDRMYPDDAVCPRAATAA